MAPAKVGGYTIPVGTHVISDVLTSHFDPAMWRPIDPQVGIVNGVFLFENWVCFMKCGFGNNKLLLRIIFLTDFPSVQLISLIQTHPEHE